MASNEQQQVAIMQRIAKLIVSAADLTRAVAHEDGTYIRTGLEAIQTHRDEVLAMIYDWKPELLARD
jgi:hypothetical protein